MDSAHILLPVTQIRYVLIFWAVSLFLYLLYFCFLMVLLLQVGEKRKQPKENEKENKDNEYVQQRLKQIVDGPIETEGDANTAEEDYAQASLNSDMNFEEVDLRQDAEVQRLLRD